MGRPREDDRRHFAARVIALVVVVRLLALALAWNRRNRWREKFRRREDKRSVGAIFVQQRALLFHS